MLLKLIFIVICVAKYAYAGEAFASSNELASMLTTESILIENLSKFLTTWRQSLSDVESILDKLTVQHELAVQEEEKYIQNPLNAFRLIHKFTNDWRKIEGMIVGNGENYTNSFATIEETHKIPTQDDLNEATLGLTRLQDTYKLNISDLMRGSIKGEQSEKLSVTDCFAIGRQLMDHEEYERALHWLLEAYWHRNSDESLFPVPVVEILDHLSFVYYQLDKPHTALKVVRALLKLDPTHELGNQNLRYFEGLLGSEAKTNPEDGDGGDLVLERDEIAQVTLPTSGMFEKYKALCRGDIPQNVSSQLTCRYARKNHPFTILAPFKEEQLSIDPHVVMYHDAVTDSEIETAISIGMRNLARAQVATITGGETSRVRVSKLAWLEDNHDQHVADLSQRIHLMTNLNIKQSGESFQLANYRIGGFYEPHHDFALKSEGHTFDDLGLGNRIATILFYFNDVPQGGATVFPELNITVTPRKGSALFWYHLFDNGEGDLRSLHAACPVLIGTKWAAIKCIHTHYQEFIRPCGLERGPVEGDYIIT